MLGARQRTKRKDKRRRKLKKSTFLHDRMDKGALKKAPVFTSHVFGNVKQVATYYFEKLALTAFELASFYFADCETF